MTPVDYTELKSESIENIGKGKYEDHYGMNNKIEKLNDMIKCSTDKFSLNDSC